MQQAPFESPAPQEPSSRVPFGKRLTALDGLRGIAILAVVCEHTLRIPGHSSFISTVWAAIQESSWAGVDLFFVLSGFLITGILLDSQNSKRYFLNFYARRSLRIFPLYYAIVAAVVFIVPALVKPSHLPEMYSRLVSNQIWLWTYTQNYLQAKGPHNLPGFGHFWTLAVEEQFYWVWPLVIFRLARKRFLILCLVICAALPIARLVLLQQGQLPWAIRQLTYTRIDSLVWGALAALALRDASALRAFKKMMPILAVLAVGNLALIFSRHGFIPYEGRDTVFLGYTSLAVLFSAMMFQLVSKPGAIANFLSNDWLRWFGKYSYCIYIVQWPVAQLFEATILKRMAASNIYLTVSVFFVFTLVLSALIAFVSWHVLEGPVLRLKDRFAYDASVSAGRSSSAPVTNHEHVLSV